MPTITPNEAAKRTGMSRRTIMRAITKGELVARRNNRNQWQIDEDGLAQWALNEQKTSNAQPEPIALSSREAVLEEQIRALKMLLDELRTDRDRWHAEAQKGFFSRLFSRAA